MKKLSVLLVLTAMLFGYTNAYAEGVRKFKKNETASLVEGIKSENEGVKKSAVFFAGKYKVEESVPALMALLDNEEDDNIKVLTLRALYEIGNENAISAITNALDDESGYVKRTSKALMNDYYVKTMGLRHFFAGK